MVKVNTSATTRQEIVPTSAEIFSHPGFDLEGECRLAVIRLTGKRIGDWLEAFAFDRDTRKPTCRVSLTTGLYWDWATKTKIPLFEWIARSSNGRYRDEYDARREHARRLVMIGQPGDDLWMPKERPPRSPEEWARLTAEREAAEAKRAEDAKPKPIERPEAIRDLPAVARERYIRRWAARMPGIDADAVIASGVMVANHRRQECLAFPGCLPSLGWAPTTWQYRPIRDDEFPGLGRKFDNAAGGSVGIFAASPIEAAKSAETWWIGESQSDALALAARLPAGHAALSVMGCQSLSAALAAELVASGKRLVLIYDSDAAGGSGADEAVRRIELAGGQASAVLLPVGYGKDVREFFANGGNVADLLVQVPSLPLVGEEKKSCDEKNGCEKKNNHATDCGCGSSVHCCQESDSCVRADEPNCSRVSKALCDSEGLGHSRGKYSLPPIDAFDELYECRRIKTGLRNNAKGKRRIVGFPCYCRTCYACWKQLRPQLIKWYTCIVQQWENVYLAHVLNEREQKALAQRVRRKGGVFFSIPIDDQGQRMFFTDVAVKGSEEVPQEIALKELTDAIEAFGVIEPEPDGKSKVRFSASREIAFRHRHEREEKTGEWEHMPCGDLSKVTWDQIKEAFRTAAGYEFEDDIEKRVCKMTVAINEGEFHRRLGIANPSYIPPDPPGTPPMRIRIGTGRRPRSPLPPDHSSRPQRTATPVLAHRRE